MRHLLVSGSRPLAPLAPFVLRVATGIIFAAHGWQKLANGLNGTAGFLETLGFPLPMLMAFLLVVAELGGGILLILGVATGLAARVLAFVSIVAWITVHTGKGFFMASGGYEFIMLLFAACISLAITGPGRWSLGAVLHRRQAAPERAA